MAATEPAAGGAGATPSGPVGFEPFKDSSVMVCVRIRPMNKREKDLGSVEVVHVTGPQSVMMDDDPETKQTDERTFGFDQVFELKANQAEVYGRSAEHVVDRVLGGYNACVFAYGQTGERRDGDGDGDGDEGAARGAVCKWARAAAVDMHCGCEADDTQRLTALEPTHTHLRPPSSHPCTPPVYCPPIATAQGRARRIL